MFNAELAGEPPLFLDGGRLQGAWGEDEDHELDGVEGLVDLLPPVFTAFEVGDVLEEGEVVGLEFAAEVGREGFAVGAGRRAIPSLAMAGRARNPVYYYV